MDLHDIARQVASTAGADFAFVLSQAGLLVTKDAPRDMPDRGRMKILWACPAGTNGEVVHLEMPREDLVPYGGAAPIDVFATRVEDTAILVAALASWHDKGQVVLALTAGAASLAELIRAARKARAQKAAAKKPADARKERPGAAPAEPRRERASAAPVEPRKERTTVPFEPLRRERPSAVPAEPRRERPSAAAPEPRKERTTVPFEPLRRERPSAAPAAPARRAGVSVVAPAPAKRERPSALPKPPREAAAVKKGARPRGAGKGAEAAPRSSSPEIEIGEAEVGRETMLAIEAFRPRSRSEPEIEIGEAEVGRETMLAIEAFRPRGRSEPEIVLGEAPVGRETLIAIDAALPRPRPGPAPEGVRVQLDSISRESMLEVERLEAAQRGRPTVDEPLVTERRTLPWVDSPAALKRTLEAREIARAAAPPEVKLGVEEIDPAALEQALRDGEKR